MTSKAVDNTENNIRYNDNRNLWRPNGSLQSFAKYYFYDI